MLGADAPGLGVYFVDDHFVPYAGAKPVPKGWNTKRRHAQRGRDDTVVTDYHGRAVCFASGEPSGLSVTLPGALAQLREVLGADAKIMLGFDRGGSYPGVFTACRDAGADWLTWRRGDLAAGHRGPGPQLPGRTRRDLRGDHPGRRDGRDQRLRPGPAAHPVRARRSR